MQNQSTVLASVALFAIVALVFWSGELEPLSRSLNWLCEQVAKVAHVEFWRRLVGVSQVSAGLHP